MNDKRIRLDCPFCHTPADKIQIVPLTGKGNASGIYKIHCPGCGCMFTGAGKQDLIDRWNCR